ncbi:TIGR04222 domain-containing membrane protein [Streptantibioticus parmotrematis]|uniref:TIGR04222 domain-containing membrane protein n=1 Tax=Streptantibioticus parmotrematis TaxID=2873249 RepID=UPI0033C94B89
MWVSLLLIAWAAAILSCARLCRAAVVVADRHPVPDGPGFVLTGPGQLGLYETAFLAGGPHRVTDLTLVAMCRERRMMLAHTGWATVVDPVGHDEVERSLLAMIGPEGQSRIPVVRKKHATAAAVRVLGERLVSDGLAVPASARDRVASGMRLVMAAAGLIVALLAVTAGLGIRGSHDSAPLWFGLPLVLTLGCLLIARLEIVPYTRWASPAGEAVLGAIPISRHHAAVGDRALLTALALRGPKVLPDPALRAALGHGRLKRAELAA